MGLKFYLLLMCICMTYAEIQINIQSDSSGGTVTYSGQNEELIDDNDVRQFKVGSNELKAAVEKHYGRWPNDVYLKSPTPWGDLYKSYGWKEVTRVISVRSARVKNDALKPTILMRKNFINNSTKMMTVDASISHTVQNSFKTTWKRDQQFTVSQNFKYGLNLIIFKASGSTSLSYSSTWGESEEKTESVTVGSKTSIATDLEPGQAVTAVLSVYTGQLEVEVEYAIQLRGDVAVNYKQPYNGHHFWNPRIGDVMESGGIDNDLTQIEKIKGLYHSNATLTIYDKKTKVALRELIL